jgi:hypothetical protein
MNSQGREQRRRHAAFGLALVAMLVGAVATGCSRGDAAPRGRVVNVYERDFKLTTLVERVPAGLVTFRVHNSGPSTHEFLVDRSDVSADALPLRPSQLSVNEESPQLDNLGELREVRLGSTRELTLRLQPGHYVVFCNLEGHYRGGMYAALEVTG